MKCLSIKDLPESKELDRKAMAMVRGGFSDGEHSTLGAHFFPLGAPSAHSTVEAINNIGKALVVVAQKA